MCEAPQTGSDCKRRIFDWIECIDGFKKLFRKSDSKEKPVKKTLQY